MRIILIVSDTYRYDNLGINRSGGGGGVGGLDILTPELDAFGQEAVIFDNCYVSSFPTIPHRCDMNTGRWGFPFHGWQPLLEDEVPTAERLREAGMYTQLLCDTPHLMSRAHNFWRGFMAYYWNRGQEGDTYVLRLNDPPKRTVPKPKTRQGWLPGFDVGVADIHRWVNREWTWEGDTFAATTSQFACKWIEQNYKCDNFFLWVDFFDVHEPWDPPEHFVELYDPGFTCQRMMHPNYGKAEWYTPEELRNIQANYAGEVTMATKWIGAVLRKLKDCSIYDETFVIFTTDHGMYIGEHDRVGKTNIHEDDDRGTWPLYNEITHIPLMIKPPGWKGSVRRSEIVQPPDICPTILEAAGVAVPDDMMGRALTPLLEPGTSAQWDRKVAVSGSALSDSPDRVPPITVTDGRWSLHLGAGHPPELYDMASDPAEGKNVFGENPDKVAELHAGLIELLEREGAPEGRIEIARRLPDLDADGAQTDDRSGY